MDDATQPTTETTGADTGQAAALPTTDIVAGAGGPGPAPFDALGPILATLGGEGGAPAGFTFTVPDTFDGPDGPLDSPLVIVAPNGDTQLVGPLRDPATGAETTYSLLYQDETGFVIGAIRGPAADTEGDEIGGATALVSTFALAPDGAPRPVGVPVVVDLAPSGGVPGFAPVELRDDGALGIATTTDGPGLDGAASFARTLAILRPGPGAPRVEPSDAVRDLAGRDIPEPAGIVPLTGLPGRADPFDTAGPLIDAGEIGVAVAQTPEVAATAEAATARAVASAAPQGPPASAGTQTPDEASASRRPEPLRDDEDGDEDDTTDASAPPPTPLVTSDARIARLIADAEDDEDDDDAASVEPNDTITAGGSDDGSASEPPVGANEAAEAAGSSQPDGEDASPGEAPSEPVADAAAPSAPAPFLLSDDLREADLDPRAEAFDTLDLDRGTGRLSEVLEGTEGADWIRGLGANDDILGNAGDDLLVGGTGFDTLRGQEGQDTLFGDAGRDLLGGGAGDDLLVGGDGADTLAGHAGDDALLGGAGDDLLRGGAGDDLLRGGSGDDTLSGGAGADTFGLALDGGTATVTDFELGIDRLDLAPPGGIGGDVDVFADLIETPEGRVLRVSDAAGGTTDLFLTEEESALRIASDAGTLILENVGLEDLEALAP
ncbi:MAG: calcium-binding protein [Shimia sp.]